MKVLCLDVETTISNKGNPFDNNNRLVSIGYTDGDRYCCFRAARLDDLQELLESSALVVGFNIKFDLHWLRKCGYNIDNIKVWDCQLAEFILSRQRIKYPSLKDSLEKYGLESKLDIVKTEYWDKGIDTDQIPWDILSEYNIQDVKQTLALYYKQQEIATPIQKRLIHLCCQDLLTLQEMEYNGLPIDLNQCVQDCEKIQQQITEIITQLQTKYPHVPINFNSPDHLSAFLYGGIIKEDSKELVGLFKTGAKAGQPKFKNITLEHQLAGLVKPIDGSELKKENLYSTAEDVLKKLKDKTGVVDALLKLAQLTKIKEFFESFIRINKEMNWPVNKIHGQFNQVTTATGRLSSTKPNLQNMCPEIQECVRSEK